MSRACPHLQPGSAPSILTLQLRKSGVMQDNNVVLCDGDCIRVNHEQSLHPIKHGIRKNKTEDAAK